MLFNSGTFAVFFVLVFALHWTAARAGRRRFAFLLVASWVFYAFWSVWYLGLILFSTVLDYAVGRALGRSASPRARRWLLLASVTGNLGILCAFKYWDFFVAEAARALAFAGFAADPFMLHVVLPVGISFYTFQTLSYTIDVYRGELEPERDFVRFALFVAFFPQLVAGPIVRARHFLPQLHRPARLTRADFDSGIALVLWGLFKKVCLGDYIGRELVDPLFGAPEAGGGWVTLLVLYAYAFQVYCDFSGYSDVAIGVARTLGFELPMNFDAPFRSASPREFWRRWHVSFTTWMRDYVYLPLGGNASGRRLLALRNLFLTMFLAGLWHGASWRFALFGVYHGALLVGDAMLGLPPPRSAARLWLRRAVTFHLFVVSFAIFRGPDLATVGEVLASVVRSPGDFPLPRYAFLVFGVAVVTHLLPPEAKARIRGTLYALPPIWKGLVYALTLGLLVNAASQATPFIYFQF